MSWSHNGERILKILAENKGDADGWVPLNEHLKACGLTSPPDVRWALFHLDRKEHRWVESQPYHGKLSMGGHRGRQWNVDADALKARLTQAGKDELLRRKALEKQAIGAGWFTRNAPKLSLLIAFIMACLFIYINFVQAPSKGEESHQNQARTTDSMPIEASPTMNRATLNASQVDTAR